MELNDLLQSKRIEPRATLIFRHTAEPALNKNLPLLAADRPDLFNAYQRVQPPKLEKAMLKTASYVASFIGHEPGQALFVGLYKIGKAKALNYVQFWQVPENIELKKLGMTGF